MKKILIDVLFGFFVIISVTICEFLVTLPFGDPSNENLSQFINYELLLTSIPTLFITFLFAWLLKPKTRPDFLRRSIIWTSFLALNFIVIGIGNANLKSIFGGIGIYVLLVFAFAGPVIHAKIKHLI